MLDPEGRVLTWNAGAERFKGYRAEEIIGQHFSRFYPPEALARGLPEHELEVATEVGAFEDEGWRVRKDGSLFWANVVITAVRNAEGELLGFAKVTRDLTQRRNHEEALRQSEERFRLLVEGVTEYAIFMLDVNGRVATWNVGAQRIKGYSAEEIIGRHFSVFYPAEARDSGWPDYELKMAAEKGSFVDNGWRLRKDGTTLLGQRHHHGAARRRRSPRRLRQAHPRPDREQAGRGGRARQSATRRDPGSRAQRPDGGATSDTRVKDEFLATLSHELRTPLSAILGWTQVLLKGGAESEPARQRRAIEVIDRNARAQVQLIDDLLDLSRIMTGKIRLDLQQVSLQTVVEAAVDSARPAADAKDIRLKADPRSGPRRPSTPMRALAAGRVEPADQCDQVHSQGRTSPGAASAGEFPSRAERQRHRHRHSGQLPAARLRSLFATRQLDHSSLRRSRARPGDLEATGRIARRLDQGRRARARARGRRSSSSCRSRSCSSTKKSSRRAHPTAETQPAELISLPQLEGVHVFVVDDEPDAREILERILRDQGAQVTSFGSAAEVLAALKTTKPTVLISDIGMPEMDGYQLMRALRAGESRVGRIPALALTAFARADDRKRSLLAGYQAHLAKPFDVGELILVVADLVGR